ncbi:MAG: glycosyltransferase family 9 protein [Acidobacteria bacterium]|nr:glycosyltransferase family 9 protein [Acidobacteriota bacterium]
MASARQPILDQLPEGARVLVVRLRSLGDCVLTTPAIRLLNEARPDLRISVMVEPRFEEVFDGNPRLDAILPPSYGAAFSARPGLCLNLHGGTRSMLLTAASLARHRAGFGHHKGAAIYTAPIPRAQEILGQERTVHTAEHLASAMFYLGVPQREIPRAELFAPPAAFTGYAVIHPFSAAAYKTWPPERFVDVAHHIERTRRLEAVIIGSAADDFGPFAEFRKVAGAPLKEVMTLISGAALFAGNDSGPAHIAAAYDIPLLVLFGREEQVPIWRPWQARLTEVLSAPEGIGAVPVEAATAALDRLR